MGEQIVAADRAHKKRGQAVKKTKRKIARLRRHGIKTP